MPSATGVAMSRASTDEYSVPQMNGRAPNWPATGSQVSVRQNCQPNWWIEMRDCRHSSKPIAATIAMISTANKPVAARKNGSEKRRRLRLRSMTAPEANREQTGAFDFDRRVVYCGFPLIVIDLIAFADSACTALGSGA